MRCPKCHYLSFEPEPRCRNCGFDLGADEPGADLSLKLDEPQSDALADLSLRDEEPRPRIRSGLPPMRRRSRAGAAARAAAPDPLHDFDPLPARGERQLVVEPEPESLTRPSLEPEYVRQLDADLEASREAAPLPDQIAADPAAEEELPAATADEIRPIRLVPPSPDPPAPPRFVAPPAPAPIAEPSMPMAPAASRDAPPLPRPSPALSRRIAAPATTELPLFVRGLPSSSDDGASDAPMVAVPAQPRAPLSVQLRSAEPPRPAQTRKPGQFDKDLLEDLRRIERIERIERSGAAAQARRSETTAAASAIARLQSLLVDAALLAAIAGVVVWLTAKFSGIPVSRIPVLPMLPLGGFLLLLSCGYLLLFTAAGGQTVGKMIAGLRVVQNETPETRVSVQQAVVRSAVAMPSLLLAGLGYVPALFGGRAVHDRVSGTRVVGA